MSATLGLAVAPFIAYARVAFDFHADAAIGASVLAAFVLWLTRGPPRGLVVLLAVPASVLAGAMFASDGLFGPVGLLPFAASGLVMLCVRRLRFTGAVVLVAAALAVLFERLTIRAFPRVLVAPDQPFQLAPASYLWPNLKRLVGLVVQVGNGNYSGFGWTNAAWTFSYALAIACAIATMAALAAPFGMVAAQLRSRERSMPHLVWGAFWSVSVAATCAGYEFSTVGERWGYYLVPVLAAIAATLPVLLATSVLRRCVAALGISVIVAGSLVAVSRPGESFGGLGGLAAVEPRIAAIARAEHAPFGFSANYFDTSSLTWASGFAVQMAPIWFCTPGVLCQFAFNSASSWYVPHHSRSFVLNDAQYGWVDLSASSQFGAPIKVIRLSSQYTMAVYSYDVASRLSHDGAVWSPALAYGAGFNSPELFDGATSRWMIEDGQLDYQSGIGENVTLSGYGFSNGEPRLLSLLAPGGRVLARQLVTTDAERISLGPFALPAGKSELTLVATPGAAPIGANDPRLASVFLEPLSIAASPAYAAAAP